MGVEWDERACRGLFDSSLVDVVAGVDAADDVLALVLEDAAPFDLGGVVNEPDRVVSPARHPERSPG